MSTADRSPTPTAVLADAPLAGELLIEFVA
jgi:hypothetical protein